jgi:hypothetical protein
MVDKLSSMHQLALTRLQIQTNSFVLITRQPNIFETSSLKVGCANILFLYDVYMTREVSILDKNFNGYWKCSASRMFAQPANIPNLMQSVKECIR